MSGPNKNLQPQQPHPSESFGTRLLAVLTSRHPYRRLRLIQWLIASLVYVGIGALLVIGVHQGWMTGGALAGWCAFIAAILIIGYTVLRSGWSERFSDPSLTIWQLSMGVVAVNWGYLICGPMRTAALLPLMVIFAFAAFSLRWRQIAFLTVLAVASLMAAVSIRTFRPSWLPVADPVDPLLVDLNNLLAILVVLPALAVIAARLSSLRQKLRGQREALAVALAEVERLAISDELTALPNRRSMTDLLARSAAHAQRGISPFCIALIDLDHFKQVNDALGHAAGDTVLRRFAEIGARAVRETDVLGRWGGEEFLLVLPGATPAEAEAVLRRIQSMVRDTLWPGRTVTFSAGVVQYQGNEPPAAVLARADRAMYQAKDAGRDRILLDRNAEVGQASTAKPPKANETSD